MGGALSEILKIDRERTFSENNSNGLEKNNEIVKSALSEKLL